MKLTNTDSVLILSHYYKRTTEGGGPAQEVRDYLLSKVKRIVFIEHPFPYADDHRSSLSLYENGKFKKIIYSPALAGPQAFYYLADIFITWYFLLRLRQRFALCVALDNLNVLSSLPLRWFGGIAKLVYYTIDYTPTRFNNRILNRLYHLADRWACYNADTIWILSPRMVESRAKNGVITDRCAPSVVLPMGAKLDRIEILPLEKINRYQLIFVGHLLEKQGLQLVLEALPDVIAEVPNTRLIVVGQGEFKPALTQLVTRLKLTPHVDFKGFVERHEDVEKILCQSAIGLAPYLPEETNFTYHTDPGKPKLYLGCGLPVIITPVPASAELIAKSKAGILIDYTKESMIKALKKLLTNDALYREYRKNAIVLSKEYNTDTLIEQAITQT